MARDSDKKVDASNRPTTTSAPKPDATTSATKEAAGGLRSGRRGSARSTDPGVRAVAATRKDDANADSGGYVEVTVPKDYGTLEGEQPDGTRKTFQTGERAILPMKQAKALELVDDDGEAVGDDDRRVPRTQSYGQYNRPVSEQDEGFEERGKSPSA